MNDFMAHLIVSLIAGAIAIPLFILALKIREESQAKKAQNERLNYSRERLHQIALAFGDECMAETKKLIAGYARTIEWKSYQRNPDYFHFISGYRKALDSLEKEYFSNYAMKYSEGDERLRREAEDIPDYILMEYKKELSRIAFSFHDLSDCIRQQIEDLKDK